MGDWIFYLSLGVAVFSAFVLLVYNHSNGKIEYEGEQINIRWIGMPIRMPFGLLWISFSILLWFLFPTQPDLGYIFSATWNWIITGVYE